MWFVDKLLGREQKKEEPVSEQELDSAVAQLSSIKGKYSLSETASKKFKLILKRFDEIKNGLLQFREQKGVVNFTQEQMKNLAKTQDPKKVNAKLMPGFKQLSGMEAGIAGEVQDSVQKMGMMLREFEVNESRSFGNEIRTILGPLMIRIADEVNLKEVMRDTLKSQGNWY